MSCPLCGDECRCSYVSPRPSATQLLQRALATAPPSESEPEAPASPAMSTVRRISAVFPSLAALLMAPDTFSEHEEQFSGAVAERPSEQSQQPAAEPEPAAEEDGPEPMHRVRTRYVPPEPMETPSRMIASPPSGGYGYPQASGGSRARTGIEREFSERAGLEQELDRRAEYWRDEVARTVQSYRTRRSRKRLAGEYSMKLDFEAPREPAMPYAASALPREEELPPCEQESALPEEAITEEAFAEELPPAMRARAHQQAPELLEDFDSFVEPVAPETTKIIEFPRPVTFEQPSFDGLAEPVLDKPRILDVPEAAANTPPAPLADVALEAEEAADALPLTAEFDVPLQVAPLGQRISAALLDGLVVLVASATFAMIVARFATGLPYTRATLVMAGLAPCVFWAVYQYLFLVYARTTPGMQMAHLNVATFDGDAAPRGLRRWRALVMMLSGASLGLGFLWALFDEDNLCWHDRMTRTYLRQG
jgi:uncharacterized RDD family membrane protein YckC